MSIDNDNYQTIAMRYDSKIILIDSRIMALAEEYVGYVDDMNSGRFIEDEERQIISAQRTLVHDELNRILETDRQSTNMYSLCRSILRCNT